MTGSAKVTTNDHFVDVRLTRHAETRRRQRGFKKTDVSGIIEYGEEQRDGTIVVLDRDIQRRIEEMRQEIVRLERLRGATAVVAGGRIVTLYKGGRSSRRIRPRWQDEEG